MSLLNELKVTLADLMPLTGRAVMVAGEATPYRVSERLYSAVQAMAIDRAVPASAIFRKLRDEIQAAG